MIEGLNPKRLKDVKPESVPVLVESSKRKEIKQQGTDIYLSHLSALYTAAAKLDCCRGSNPFNAAKADAPAVENKTRPKFITGDELKKLLDTAKAQDDQTCLLVALAVHAGLRKDEAANLLWSEVDFDNRVITPQNHADDEKKGIQEFRLKSKKARSIPLKPALVEILMPLKQASGYVIPDKAGKSMQRFRCNMHGFHKARMAAGLPDCTIHTLRHTFVSLLLQAGVSIFKVSQWAGHSSVKITSDVYAHLQAYDPDIERF